MSLDLRSKLDAARKDLLDLGLRNTLINYRTRTRKVDIVDEISSEIYRVLVQEGKSMSFLPASQEMVGDGSEWLEKLFPNEGADRTSLFGEDRDDSRGTEIATRHSDTRLQTRMSPDDLHTRLLRMQNDARAYIEEQGVNILYLALGFLGWYETSESQTERKAPLLLIPVELTRTSARERFRLSYTGEDIGPNLSLIEKLRLEFTVTLPGMDHDNGEGIDAYFATVREQIAGYQKWTVYPNEIALGFFSFGKLLMYKDLDCAAWPDERDPTQHPILDALLGDGFPESTALASDDANVDELVSAADSHQVLDADSSQVLAIQEAIAGRNLVIQGPPGTGKSQTIANIIRRVSRSRQDCSVRIGKDGGPRGSEAPPGRRWPRRISPGIT